MEPLTKYERVLFASLVFITVLLMLKLAYELGCIVGMNEFRAIAMQLTIAKEMERAGATDK